jgi:polysaccharide pyruvyl transferase WcaK-like protein
MSSKGADRLAGSAHVTELQSDGPSSAYNTDQDLSKCPRIALLTPYTGGNLGDAAIQDAVIANIRVRLPDAQFSGITLNCRNFLEQHGSDAFPLVGTDIPFFRMENKRDAGAGDLNYRGARVGKIKRALSNALGSGALKRGLKKARAWVTVIRAEVRHSVAGHKFLRTQDLLIISGGGQLDEEWGGAWGHPFALFKWTILARLTGVPCAVVSVGAGKVSSTPSQLFLSAALRMACYRSYRDKNSREIAATLLHRAKGDPVVPDLAFSLPPSKLPPAAGIRDVAQGRPIVAIAPIAYAKRGNWPTPDHAVHERYVQELAQVISCLSRQGYFVAVACSSLGDDETVIPELVGSLGDETNQRLGGQIHFPIIGSWTDFVAFLRDADYLIASRLHSAILGFVAKTPAIAISFDPKVEWLMEDLQQTDYLLQIRDFTSQEVLNALGQITVHRDAVVERIASYTASILAPSASQYDTLASLIVTHHQSHN